MANTQRSRVSPQVLQADMDAYLSLKVIAGYQPSNPAHSLSAIAELHDKLRASLETELHAHHAFAAARDASLAMQWEFHDAILGVKNQVKAQYGANSDEVATLGLKKKSERRTPTRATKPSAAQG